jgi:methylmalonyl-CoA mutase N-terminal domain/subunit
MYRERVWTMRQYSGFGSAEETNERFRYLLQQGQTGLSVAFDLPTQLGLDADSPRASGEVGKVGVPINTIEDMRTLLNDIPLDKVSTSMTINSTAPTLMAAYVAVAEERGIPPEALRGTTQNDILKEYVARNTYIYPPRASLRLSADLIDYCAKQVPKWYPISISGYHIREAGANAVQELAFTFANAIEYVKTCLSRGMTVDSFAPRLSFFFACQNDFFEEVAKFRAARRIWAEIMKETFNAQTRESWMLRFHTQTSGESLTAKQPQNNIVRVTLQALAAVLGGTQSLHTNSYDEAWALPTEDAATIALRTQQTIAEETGVADVIDPLGGSYYLEALTDEMERRAYEYFDRIESLGGVLPAIKDGFFQREIADTAYKYQRQIEQGERTVVGVNQYMIKEQQPLNTLKVDVAAQERQVRRLRELRARRDNLQVKKALENLRRTLENDKANCIAPILDAVKQYATLGEIVDVGRRVFGDWKEPGIL